MTNPAAFAAKQTPSHKSRVNPFVAVAALAVPLTILAGCSRDSKPRLIEHQAVELGRGVATFLFEKSAYSLINGSFSGPVRERMEADAKKLGVSVNELGDKMQYVLEFFVIHNGFITYPKIGSKEEAVFKSALFAVVSGMIDESNKRGNPPIASLTCTKFDCLYGCAVKTAEANAAASYGPPLNVRLPSDRVPDFTATAKDMFIQLAGQSAVRIGGGTSINSQGNFQTDNR